MKNVHLVIINLSRQVILMTLSELFKFLLHFPVATLAATLVRVLSVRFLCLCLKAFEVKTMSKISGHYCFSISRDS